MASCTCLQFGLVVFSIARASSTSESPSLSACAMDVSRHSCSCRTAVAESQGWHELLMERQHAGQDHEACSSWLQDGWHTRRMDKWWQKDNMHGPTLEICMSQDQDRI